MKKNNEKRIQHTTQAVLPIEEIKEGVVVMRDQSLRAIVMVSSLNFALKSESEKDAVIYSFQEFLNSLDFPIQMVTTSRKMDLSAYLDKLAEYYNKEESALIRFQIEEYQSFIAKLLEYSNIMEKRFYVVIPYYGNADMLGQIQKDFLKHKKNQEEEHSFEDKKRGLAQRIDLVVSGLTAIGLRCAVLGTEDLLELLYSLYNPDVSVNEKVGNVEEIDVPLITSQPEQQGGVQ